MVWSGLPVCHRLVSEALPRFLSHSMMNGMSFSETIFLFFLALIIFGPKKLPEIARQVGKYLNEFRRASNEFKAQIEQEIAHLEVENNKQAILPPSPTVEGTTSRSSSSASADVNYAEPPASADSAPTTSASETSSLEPVSLATSPEVPHGSDDGASPPVATEGIRSSEEVTSTTSQESHA